MEAGRRYRITHKRKGVFEAEVLDVAEEYVTVRIDTSRGTGLEHFANAFVYVDGYKRSPMTTDKLLRHELIEGAEEIL